jgi:hypothetical protein
VSGVCLVYLEPLLSFSKQLWWLPFSPAVGESSTPSTPLPTLEFTCFSFYPFCGECVVLTCGFNLHFMLTDKVEHLFICSLVIWMSFEQYSFKYLFCWIAPRFFHNWFIRVLYILWALTFLKNFLFIYSHVHTLFGPFLPSAPHSLPLPLTLPRFQGDPVLPLSLIFLKRRQSSNKDKAFLLVERRTATQRDS